MGIRDNGGGGGSAGGARNGDVNSSGEEVSSWYGFIVEGYRLVVSLIVSVVVHIVGF